MIRRLFCGIIVTIAVLMCQTACSGDTSSPIDYQSSVKGASVSFDYGFESYTADITFDGNIPDKPEIRRDATISFTSPEDLTGLVLKYTENSAVATVGKLSLDLPKSTGVEMYYIIRLFSMYPDELFEKNSDSAKFRADVSGCEVTFEVFLDKGVPSSANIKWNSGQIKVTKISLS